MRTDAFVKPKRQEGDGRSREGKEETALFGATSMETMGCQRVSGTHSRLIQACTYVLSPLVRAVCVT